MQTRLRSKKIVPVTCGKLAETIIKEITLGDRLKRMKYPRFTNGSITETEKNLREQYKRARQNLISMIDQINQESTNDAENIVKLYNDYIFHDNESIYSA